MDYNDMKDTQIAELKEEMEHNKRTWALKSKSLHESINTLRQWKNDAVAAKNKAEANLQELRGKCRGLVEALEHIKNAQKLCDVAVIPPHYFIAIATNALDAYKRKGESDDNQNTSSE